ncbi:MAG: MBOAT family protein, partial [Lachnospiraceae bacterium]|nr:MBOAT family protein [Lachnospiraceae bacterium]
ERKPDILKISYGCKRFVIGLAKKVLLANNLGLMWTEITNKDLGSLTVLMAWLGITAFAFQIYFDFSGYSDMALGLGAILGFQFPENFNYPYISVTVTEFWRRWHISLGNWFKEYVYIPFGGNRKGLLRQLLNILIVWMLTGIWHGAGWNFLGWGLWFAFWLILEKIGLKKLFEILPKGICRIYTWVLVLISWVFFDIEDVGSIVGYLLAMFGQNGAGIYNREAIFVGMENLVLFVIAIVASTPLCNRIATRLSKSYSGHCLAVYRVLEKLFPALLLIASIAYIVDATYNPFLYFRF